MTFRIFIDSSTGVDVLPQYDYQDGVIKTQHESRSRDGSLYQYKWSTHRRLKFGVRFVNSEFKSIVNSWWESNADLLFMEVGGTEVYSVHLMGDKSPVNKIERPYSDQFAGVIELEGY